MPYKDPTFSGDEEYSVCCKGDCVVGDEVRFERARFAGPYRRYGRSHFDGFELVTGKIVADSYGADKQQHTFTLELPDGKKMRIKGRNLYRNGTWRKRWADETTRISVQADKHARGKQARRESRQASEFIRGY